MKKTCWQPLTIFWQRASLNDDCHQAFVTTRLAHFTELDYYKIGDK